MAAGGRLPRGRAVDPPRPGELVRKHTGADLQNGWLGRHGQLHLTDDRLVFVPTPLDRVLGGKRHQVVLDELAEIERHPVRPGEMGAGGKRPRMLLHAPECVYEMMVPDLDGWIDAIVRVYRLRARAGRPYMPPVRREGYRDLLAEDDAPPASR